MKAKYSTLYCSAAAIAMLTSGHAYAEAQGPAGREAVGVADIVVTAQKREQSLQSVPVAVTALTTDTLTANRIQNVGDLNAMVPNKVHRGRWRESPLPDRGSSGKSMRLAGLMF